MQVGVRRRGRLGQHFVWSFELLDRVTLDIVTRRDIKACARQNIIQMILYINAFNREFFSIIFLRCVQVLARPLFCS